MGIFLLGVNLNVKPGGATTNFFPVTGGQPNNTNESFRQSKTYVTGTLKNLGVAVDNGGTARTAVSRINTANGTLAPTITDSVAGAYYDTTNSDSLSLNDLVDVRSTINATGTTTFWWQVMEFIAASGHVGLYSGQGGGSMRGATRFGPVNGGSAGGTVFATEAQAQFTVRTPGVWKNISAIVSVNTSNGASVIKNRVNGADGGTSFTIASGSGAGIFDDGGSGSDTVASGDLICISQDSTAGSSGTFTVQQNTSTIAATSGSASDMWVAGNAVSRTASASVHYNPPIGQNNAWSDTTESLKQQVQPNFAFKVSNFRVKAFTNTYSAAATVTLRKNGSDVITLSIPAGSTTEVEDASTVVSFTASDNFDISVTGGTSGAAVFQYFGYVLNTFNVGWTTGATRIIDGGIG